MEASLSLPRFSTAALAAALLVCAACGKSSDSVTQIPPGAQCPTGGVQVRVGDQTQVICNGTNGTNGTTGTNGFTTLVTSSPLAVGDAHCSGGGVRVDSGLDNGAGGGIAKDGILQTGEILSTQFVCSGDNGQRVGSMTPPAGAAGSFTLKALGGAATAGSGGNGGTVNLTMQEGSNGGHIKVFRTGAVDASFTFPTVPAGDFGSNPANVTTSTTVTQQQTNAPVLDTGVLFLYGYQLYTAVAGGHPGTLVTGLSVAAGATLTFAPFGSSGIATLVIKRSCAVAGSLAVAAANNASGGLSLTCGDYFGDSTSSVSTVGAVGTANTAGGNGGGIAIQADSFWNKGAFDASGGAGSPGGIGGGIAVGARRFTTFNTGALRSAGGAAMGGAGGSGGKVFLVSGSDLNNSGSIVTSGGAGLASGGNGSPAGGSGGFAILTVQGVGSLHNSGNITTSGGSVAASCASAANCTAGTAGDILIASNSGSLVESATVLAVGGSSASGQAASGGSISLHDFTANSDSTSSTVPAGNLMVSGNIDASSGSGASASTAGTISMVLSPGHQPAGQELILLGYSTIAVDGGQAQATGSSGSAGAISLTQNVATQISFGTNNPSTLPGGAVINYADLSATGRGASPGTAAAVRSGSIILSTQNVQYFNNAPFEVAVSNGNIDVSGRAGGTGGRGGFVSIYGRAGATLAGAIKGPAGASTTNGGTNGGTLQAVSENGPLVNGASVDMSGGAGTGASNTGGQGGQITLSGFGLTNTGTLLAPGGADDSATAQGGAGGAVVLLTLSGLTSNTVAAPAGISVSGGAGKTAGTPGTVEIDGRYVTSSWTH